MKKIFNIKKIFLYFLAIYSLLFIILGVLAPVLAYSKQFYAADIIYLLMHKSCTQEALRCFWVFGYQMAICARCLGSYIGVIIAIILELSNIRFNKMTCLLLTIIAFGEILLEVLKVYSGNNYIRLVAGIALGGVIIILPSYLLEKKGNNNV